MNKKFFIFFYIFIMNGILYSMDDKDNNSMTIHPQNMQNDSMVIHCNFEKMMNSSVIVYFDYFDILDKKKEEEKRKKNEDINQKDIFADTALHRAIDTNKIAEIKELLKEGDY